MSAFPLDDIQGNILRGYRMPTVRHFVLGIESVPAARRALERLAAAGDTDAVRITTAAPWTTKPTYCLNIAFTFAGLQALGLPDAMLGSFPEEFRTGAVGRAEAVGDVRENAPEHWHAGLGAAPGETPGVHLLLSLYGRDRATLEARTIELRSLFTADNAMTEFSCQEGEALPDSRVHFGYVDGLSQPHIEGAEAPKCACPHENSPAGDFLLGYPGSYGTYPTPQPPKLGLNGTFCAYRILSQDVLGFEAYLEKAAAETHLDKELIAAKMCGRWRNGVPLALSPDTSHPSPALSHAEMNAFDYRPTTEYPNATDDWRGEGCPFGSHIRRANPRSGDVAGFKHPTEMVNGMPVVTESGTPRRIIRRGVPYGPPHNPNAKRKSAPEEAGVERGLLLLVLCASLKDQYEFLMTQWINGTDFTSVAVPKDPLLGNFTEEESRFVIPRKGQPALTLTGFSRFVGTRGSAYGFIPSLTTLRYLARGVYDEEPVDMQHAVTTQRDPAPQPVCPR